MSAIKPMRTSGKGFFGDLISSVAQPLGALAGTALGGPLGTIIGGGLGSAISPIAKRLPFQQGGVVMMPMKKKKTTKKAKAPAKGSKAMKLKMARLRAMRK